MELLVITTDYFWNGEAKVLNHLLANYPIKLHLRKPHATELEIRALLDGIAPSFYDRIVLHEHFDLLQTYPLKGVHLNRRNPVPPYFSVQSVSRSTHSLEELQTDKAKFNYSFLSPIFDSISKVGYPKAFSHETLLQAKADGLLTKQVMALGGVSTQNIGNLSGYGFGGAVVLGALWGENPAITSLEVYQQRLEALFNEMN